MMKILSKKKSATIDATIFIVLSFLFLLLFVFAIFLSIPPSCNFPLHRNIPSSEDTVHNNLLYDLNTHCNMDNPHSKTLKTSFYSSTAKRGALSYATLSSFSINSLIFLGRENIIL